MSGKFFLVNQCLTDPSVHFELGEGKFVVGRSSECDFVLHDASVSRRHAEITVEKGSVTVHDLDSRNGTFINERRVQTELVLIGSLIQFGAEAFVLAYHKGSGELESDFSTAKWVEKELLPAAQTAASLLSPAQRRVFSCLLNGFAEKRIAVGLKISQHTVHNHVQAIYRQFGVHSRSELLVRLLRRTDKAGSPS